MMKTFTRLSLLAIFALPFSTSYGQVLQNAGAKVATIQKQNTGSLFNSSPDLKHQHDGEHCISDALTHEWIDSYEIVEQYKNEQTFQNHLAHQPVSGERASSTIPIIFHVVHNPNNPSENVSEADINALLNAVNLDFTASNSDIGNLRSGFGWSGADADIDFCLAQRDPWGNQLTELGINRVSTNEDYYDPNSESNKMKGNTSGNTGTPGWDRTSYVNVWICDITNGASSGVAGYAYKPTISSLPPASIDGIVIDYNLGMTPSSRVLTHEIGHYLGLSHTWGNSNSASGCTADDGLTDTPVTAGPSFNYGGSCSGSQQTCPGTETQYENFMDYANCTVIYTTEQGNLMNAVLNGSRASLLSSDGCVPINPLPPVADFVADITTIVAGGSINFTDLSTNYPTGWMWTSTASTGVTFINSTSATDQDVTMQFANTGTYTIELDASNAYGVDNETKVAYINVVASGGGTTACDTSRNYTMAEEANAAVYGITGEAGYYPSQATLNTGTLFMDAYAEPFNASAPTEVRRIRLPIYQADDIGAASNVTFRVWSDVAGQPSAVLGTEVMAISSLNAGFYNVIDFVPAVPVNGNYWVGIEYDYTTGFDTVMLGTTNFNDRPAGTSTTMCNISGGVGWTLTSGVFGSNPDCSLILDVLTSNGPGPTAIAAWPPNETCEGMDVTMNGYGSTNTTSYYWDISDGTNDYFFDEGNLTTGFTAGTWTFNLEADGSCLTDVDGPFVLTVNPPLTASFNVGDENCIAADGSITITVSGGDGGAYNYSINNGATTESTGAYTNLIAGDYTYILSDNANCELTGTVNVGNINTFAPTITPDATIAAGTSTTLTVTGGASWSWYANEGAGPILVANTQSITVAPLVTTTYSCNVTDGSGCESELDVTLTVSNPQGLNEALVNSFEMYPNPTEGEFQLVFKLNETKDLNIEILNIIGDQVFSKGFTDVQSQTINFDLTDMAAGVYFVTIQSGTETVSKKIVLR